MSDIKQRVEEILNTDDLDNLDLSKLKEREWYDLFEKVFFRTLSDKNFESISDVTQTTLNDNELLATKAQYTEPGDFSLIELDDGNPYVVVSVSASGNTTNIKGSDVLKFEVPTQDIGDLKRFITLLRYLDEISKIKYPVKGEIELERR